MPGATTFQRVAWSERSEPTITAIKSEVTKENKKLREDSTRYRRDIAELKRRVAELSRAVAFLRKQEQKRVTRPPSEEAAESGRFSPKWLKAHRVPEPGGAGA